MSAHALVLRGSILRAASNLHRGEYFAGLFIVGCVSGLTSTIARSVKEIGWADALFTSFGISLIAWVSCIAGVFLILRDRTRGVSSLELLLTAGFIVLVILPMGALSWLAVTGLSIYILVATDVSTSRRGAFILLTATVPMLWGRLSLLLCANSILAADASLVSWLLGTHRTGNLVEFADNSGQLVIFPPCSSLANVTLAVLCWVTLSQLVCYKKPGHGLLWCLLACVAVVVVNVTRVTILGQSEWHYATFHNEWGDAFANIVTLCSVVGICALGVRRELLQCI